MDRTSGAGAIGAMQVLPATGRWMSLYAGRDLHLRRLHDNATAGVTAAAGARRRDPLHAARGRRRTTRASARSASTASTARPGRYVANVSAIRQRLEAGRPPA